MQVRCKGYLTFRELIGERILELGGESPTLHDLLDALCVQAGEELSAELFDPHTGEINDHVAILLNGRHYTHLPERLDTPLQDGDEVAIFPPIAGGGLKGSLCRGCWRSLAFTLRQGDLAPAWLPYHINHAH